MDWLSVLEGWGWFAAPVLGLLVALDPCTLAASITAVGFICHGQQGVRVIRSSLFYALGRTVTYLVLLLALRLLMGAGVSSEMISAHLVRWGGGVIGPVLITLGALLLLLRYIPLPGIRVDSTRLRELHQRHESLGAFLMGMLFSLAICPSVALIFFGFLFPLVLGSPAAGWLLVVIFSLFTALPVALLGWVMSYSMERVGAYYRVLGRMQRWLSVAMAVLFMLTGLQMMLESHHCDHNHGDVPSAEECPADCPLHTS